MRRFGLPSPAVSSSGFRRLPRRVLRGYLLAEVGAWAHHSYAKQRARGAPPPERVPADPEYGAQFLSLARCDARGGSADPLACARFVRHAFFGAPPEALSRQNMAAWLHNHLGDAISMEEAIGSLEAALGPYAPAAATDSPLDAARIEADAPSFVYGEGPLNSLYKPLAVRLLLEGQRLAAKLRLLAEGFVEQQDPRMPLLRYWFRQSYDSESPLLVVLHGYGRGLASPLFGKLLPDLGKRNVLIVDCSWLLVTRVPKSGDVTSTPTVHEIAEAVADFLLQLAHQHRGFRSSSCADTTAAVEEPVEVDVLAHSFGTAVASALTRELEQAVRRGGQTAGNCGSNSGKGSTTHQDGGRDAGAVVIRRAVLLDPMCFMPGITKQAQLLRRTPRDVAAELLADAVLPGGASVPNSPPSSWEVFKSVVFMPEPQGCPVRDEAAAARERRRWVIFQTYFFYYFIFRDLMYSWVNVRCLQGQEYLDRGHLRRLNCQGRLLTVLAETDTMIPAPLLRDELSREAPEASFGGVLWLPTVGHGACQHRQDVSERIGAFLAAA